MLCGFFSVTRLPAASTFWRYVDSLGINQAKSLLKVMSILRERIWQLCGFTFYRIPMLAWIANRAPSHLKATFFAVMASFTNLALSLSNLGTKYLNQIFTVSREILDPLTGLVTASAD